MYHFYNSVVNIEILQNIGRKEVKKSSDRLVQQSVVQNKAAQVRLHSPFLQSSRPHWQSPKKGAG